MKEFLLLLLILVPISSALTMSDGDDKMEASLTSLAGTTSSGSDFLFLTIEDVAGLTNDGSDILCTGFVCQLLTVSTVPEEVIHQVIGGGGGGGQIIPTQNSTLNTTALINESLKICYSKGGEPVNIKGGIFCKINETYTPLGDLISAYPVMHVWGIDLPDFGKMIYKKNGNTGWIIILLSITAVGLYYSDKRDEDKRKIKRLKRELEERDGG